MRYTISLNVKLTIFQCFKGGLTLPILLTFTWEWLCLLFPLIKYFSVCLIVKEWLIISLAPPCICLNFSLPSLYVENDLSQSFESFQGDMRLFSFFWVRFWALVWVWLECYCPSLSHCIPILMSFVGFLRYSCVACIERFISFSVSVLNISQTSLYFIKTPIRWTQPVSLSSCLTRFTYHYLKF